MQWTCDKCGKTMQISSDQLAETEGTVVCPQCLATAVVPGYKRRSKRQSPAPPPDEQPAPPAPPPHRNRTAMQQPPAHRKAITFVDQPAPQRTGQRSTPSTGKPQKKKKSKKKSRNKGCLAPPSTLGCIWRSVVYTLLLLLLYSALGFLLQCT